MWTFWIFLKHKSCVHFHNFKCIVVWEQKSDDCAWLIKWPICLSGNIQIHFKSEKHDKIMQKLDNFHTYFDFLSFWMRVKMYWFCRNSNAPFGPTKWRSLHCAHVMDRWGTGRLVRIISSRQVSHAVWLQGRRRGTFVSVPYSSKQIGQLVTSSKSDIFPSKWYSNLKVSSDSTV